jgi:hypothetical protein
MKYSIKTLKEAMNYLRMEEIREVCQKLNLPYSGRKMQLIERVIIFLSSGKIIKVPKFPAVSRAVKGTVYKLAPNSLLLDGAYKNDLKTRLFFKKLIGNHFHFTAFGQDWTRERWYAGNPPTYQEFADMWVKEYKRRQENGAVPKEEWAFINFTQRYIKQNPKATKNEIHENWEKERFKNKELVMAMLNEFSRNT